MDLTQLREEGRELRFDRGGLRGRGKRTPQGFLQVPGNLTRVGVLTYARSDGSEFRELRHPDEVFKADSLATLAFAPVTDRHPCGLVTPQNVREVQVGIVTGARDDGRFVSGDLVIQSDQAISRVISGDLRELSPGYTCRIDHVAGEWQGEKYDGIQQAIIYNHLAMGPREWGRSGPEVALKLDGQTDEQALGLFAVERFDARHGNNLGGFLHQQMELHNLSPRELAEKSGLDEFLIAGLVHGFGFPKDSEARAIASAMGIDLNTLMALIPKDERRDQAPTRGMDREQLRDPGDPLDRLLPSALRKRAEEARRGDSNPKGPEEMTTTIKLDGQEFEITKNAAVIIEAKFQAFAAEVKRADEAEGKLDGVIKERDEIKIKLDEATKPETISALVTARVGLEKAAHKVLGPETKLDSKSDAEIKLDVLKASDDTFDPKDRSDDYINGRFDMVVASSPERNHSRDNVLRAISGGRVPNVTRTDDTEERIDTAEAAKEKAKRDGAALSRKPLRVSVTS